jgi:hypothetical protein
MPEAAMDENGELQTRKCNVRLTGQLTLDAVAANTQPPERSAESTFAG